MTFQPLTEEQRRAMGLTVLPGSQPAMGGNMGGDALRAALAAAKGLGGRAPGGPSLPAGMMPQMPLGTPPTMPGPPGPGQGMTPMSPTQPVPAPPPGAPSGPVGPGFAPMSAPPMAQGMPQGGGVTHAQEPLLPKTPDIPPEVMMNFKSLPPQVIDGVLGKFTELTGAQMSPEEAEELLREYQAEMSGSDDIFNASPRAPYDPPMPSHPYRDPRFPNNKMP